MTERPLPFFGAGGQSCGIFMGLFFFGSNIAGLFSIANLICLTIGVLQVYVFKKAREFDQFGPEAFVAGIFAPRRMIKGYHITKVSSSPYSSIKTTY